VWPVLLLSMALLLTSTSCMSPKPYEPGFSLGDVVAYKDCTTPIPVRYVGTAVGIEDDECLILVMRNGHEETGRLVRASIYSVYRVSSWKLAEFEGFPQDYYEDAAELHSSSTLQHLEEVLLDFRQRFSYETHIYDCSNMSAYLERYLENHGFDARIRGGPTPWAPEDSKHAWVMVRTCDGYDVPVEATHPAFAPMWAPGIVYPGYSHYDEYEHGVEGMGSYYDFDSIFSFAYFTEYTEYGWWWWLEVE